MNLSQQAKAELHRKLARRIKALGGDVGEVEAITHDERSQIRLLEAMIGLVETLMKVKA
jgi:hypothetical protein